MALAMAMAKKQQIVVVAVVMMSIFVKWPEAEAAVTCNQVISTVYPCLTFVTNGGGVPPACCSGVQSLNNQARTTPDRQGVCRCLKSVTGGMSLDPNVLARAATLPSKCGVNLPYQISPSTDCSTVK